MNRQSGRIGLYLVMIVMLVMGYLYLNNQVAVQSGYSLEELEEAVADGRVQSAVIYPNSEVPTGAVTVEIQGEGRKKLYATDVTEVESMLREHEIKTDVEDVARIVSF